MTFKGLSQAGFIVALAAIATACGTPPPDSVTIPRSNPTAQNASQAEAQSDGLSGAGTGAVDSELADINLPSADEVNVVDELPQLDNSIGVEDSFDSIEPLSDVPDSSVSDVGTQNLDSSAPEAPGISEVASGQFFTADPDHPTSGSMKVFEVAGQAMVELDEDFNTASGPDLQLVAFRGEEVPDRVSSNDYVTIADLSTFTGPSVYPVPQDLDLDEFGAIAIWSAEFNTVFGYAPL